jgi:hypothetical protein
VVEPPADQPERDGERGNVDYGPALAAAGDEAPLAPHHGQDDAGEDAQRVCADRDRSEVPDAAVRAGDGGEDGGQRAGPDVVSGVAEPSSTQRAVITSVGIPTASALAPPARRNTTGRGTRMRPGAGRVEPRVMVADTTDYYGLGP